MFSFPTLRGWPKTEHGQDKKESPRQVVNHTVNYTACGCCAINFLHIVNFLALSIQASL